MDTFEHTDLPVHTSRGELDGRYLDLHRHDATLFEKAETDSIDRISYNVGVVAAYLTLRAELKQQQPDLFLTDASGVLQASPSVAETIETGELLGLSIDDQMVIDGLFEQTTEIIARTDDKTLDRASYDEGYMALQGLISAPAE